MSVIWLTNKRVVITGGARGLGRAFAEAAIGSGARVVIGDILEDRGRQTASDLAENGEIHFRPLDLADPKSVQLLSTEALRILGGIGELWGYSDGNWW